MTTKMKVMVLIPILLLASATLASAEDLWLHVYVQDGSDETVKVNVPLSLVESILPMIETDEFKGGKIQVMEEIEAEGVDIRGIWQELRNAKDGDYVTVQGQDENVRVSKEDGYIKINVDEGDDQVRVRVPLEVLDALFSGDEDELDLLAAIRTLGKFAGEDLVVVESDDETVRIWIDESQEIEG